MFTEKSAALIVAVECDVAPEIATRTWTNAATYVGEQLATLRGVAFHTLGPEHIGTFSISVEPLKPIFQYSERFLQKHGLHCTRNPVSAVKDRKEASYSNIATRSGVSKGIVKKVLSAYFAALGAEMGRGGQIKCSFGALGAFFAARSSCVFQWYSHWVSGVLPSIERAIGVTKAPALAQMLSMTSLERTSSIPSRPNGAFSHPAVRPHSDATPKASPQKETALARRELVALEMQGLSKFLAAEAKNAENLSAQKQNSIPVSYLCGQPRRGRLNKLAILNTSEFAAQRNEEKVGTANQFETEWNSHIEQSICYINPELEKRSQKAKLMRESRIVDVVKEQIGEKKARDNREHLYQLQQTDFSWRSNLVSPF